MSSVEEFGFMASKKNLNRQGTKVLHDIANAYETGVFDDPQSAMMFCSLLACICEGKVQGALDEHSGNIKWSLTPEYEEKLNAFQAAVTEAARSEGRIVQGPW